MIIDEIAISGYRSLEEISLELGNVTVLVGPNGCGKSNIYQAIQHIASAATGQFGRRIAEEGGIPSILWAGGWKKNEKPRVKLTVKFDELIYEMEFGRIPDSDRVGLAYFKQDPDIKLETVQIQTGKKRVTLLERKRSAISARNMDGRTQTYPEAISESESVLSELREPHKFPELSQLRSEFLKWRFYHDFRTDFESPLREPQLGTMTHTLSHDGRDLAATLHTIRAVGNANKLDEQIDNAFPYSQLNIREWKGVLDMEMTVPGLYRPLNTKEFSDGTLQYLCLLAALSSPRPAPFVVLNEPETSIHQDLMRPLSELIKSASEHSQILLTTHSKDLAMFLSRSDDTSVIELEKIEGATCLKGKSKKRDRSDDYYLNSLDGTDDEN
jgi:predicted ATPase